MRMLSRYGACPGTIDRMHPQPDVPRRIGPIGRAALAAHVVVIGVVVAYIALCLIGGEDANIGLGIGLLGLGALGLPWTQPALASHSVSIDTWPYVAASLGGLALNLVLHALAWWLAGKRRT